MNWINLTQCRSVLIIDFAIDDVAVETPEDVAMNVTVTSSPVPTDPMTGTPPVAMAPLSGSPLPADIAMEVPSTPSKFGTNVLGFDKEEGTMGDADNKVVPDNQVNAPETEDPSEQNFPSEPLSLVERLRRNLPEEIPQCSCFCARKLKRYSLHSVKTAKVHTVLHVVLLSLPSKLFYQSNEPCPRGKDT